MARTPRGRIYLLAEEKRVLIELFAKLNAAGQPGAWSRETGVFKGRPPKGITVIPARISEELAARIRTNAALRRQSPADYLGHVVKSALDGKEGK